MKDFKFSFLTLVFALACFVVTGYAQKPSEKMVKDLAKNWVKYYRPDKIQSHKINYIQYRIYNGDTSFCVVSFEQGGCMMVSCDLNALPVLAYSYQGSFDVYGASPQTEALFQNYAEQIDYIKKNNIKNEKSQKLWKDILKEDKPKRSKASVSSLLEATNAARWADWSKYFPDAPPSTTSSPASWTCVPVALSQLMKYYRWPLMGVGSESYTWNGTTPPLAVDFSRQTYNFDLMPFRLSGCANPALGGICNDASWAYFDYIITEQIEEVGKLNYDAAIANRMNWLGNRGDCCGGSTDTCDSGNPAVTCGISGNTNVWATSLRDHFRYIRGNEITVRDTASNADITEFKDSIRNRIDDGTPVLVRLNTVYSGAGHAVLIDGYEDDHYFHVNMGHGGSENMYYALFATEPDTSFTWIGRLEYYSQLGLVPDCPTASNVNQNTTTTISSTGSGYYEAKDNLTISNMTVQGTGSTGGVLALTAGNSVTIESNFTLQAGATMIIVTHECGVP